MLVGGQKRRDGHRKNQEGSRASGVACKHLSLHRCCLPDETTDSRLGGNRKNSRGTLSVGRRHAPVRQLVMPADETTDSRPPRGAPSSSPPHPHPSQVPPAVQVGGGCKPAYGTLGRETRRGHWSAGAGGLVALLRTDDGGRTMGGTSHWRGAAEYALWTERREKGRKERGDRQDVL